MKTPQEIALQQLRSRLTKRFHKACADYHLIEDGDHILIGLSGGKDSLALVEFLGRRAQIFVPRFQVTAVHIRVKERDYHSDLTYLEGFCAQFAHKKKAPLCKVYQLYHISTENAICDFEFDRKEYDALIVKCYEDIKCWNE